MKKLGKVIVFMLAAIMMLAMCSCSADPQKAIVATWTWDFDVTDIMNEQLSAMLGDELDVKKDLVIPILIIFDEDGEGEFTVDEDKFAEPFEEYLAEVADAAVDFMYQQMEDQMGMSRDEVDSMFEQSQGSSVKEYMESTLAELDIDQLLGEMTMDFYWEIDEDLLLIAEDEDDLSEDNCLEFEIKGNKMIINDMEGDVFELSEMDPDFPVEWKKK